MPRLRPTATPLLLALALTLAACSAPIAAPPPPPVLADQTSGTDALLIGSDAVSDDVVWLSGTGGTVLRTTDGGASWQASVIPGADTLQLRDIVGLDARTALALSIGTGASSRIYKTTDGGASWRTTFVNQDAAGFFDCMAFWDGAHGLAFSDSIEDGFLVVTTSDGGETWQRVPPSALPAPASGEGGFASSGTCVTTRGDAAWIATGNASPARVLRTDDRGATWTAATAPVASGEAAGLTSVVFRTDDVGVALGGDIANADSTVDAVARSADGGRSWTAGGRLPFPGAAYGAAYVPGTGELVAVGPGGAALSRDDGASWTLLDDRTFWGVVAASPDAVWMVGPDGRIVRARFPRR